MNTKSSYIIFSVERKELSDRENYYNTMDAKNLLLAANIPAIEIEGRYDDRPETSLMIAWSGNNECIVMGLTQAYNQECYLVVDSNGMGHLIHTDGSWLHTLGEAYLTSQLPLGDHSKLPGNRYLIFK